jgi:urocanate hydratase
VATGSEDKRIRIERVLTTDPMMGVFRHVDAGYEEAIAVAQNAHVNIPGLSDAKTD